MWNLIKLKKKKKLTECYKLLKEAYGKNFLSGAFFELYKQFSKGGESTEDNQCPGRPLSISTPQTETKINETVHGVRRMSFWMIAETVNTNKETVRKNLHDELNMKKVYTKLTPKNLTTNQKLVCQQICLEFLERLAEESALRKTSSLVMKSGYSNTMV